MPLVQLRSRLLSRLRVVDYNGAARDCACHL